MKKFIFRFLSIIIGIPVIASLFLIISGNQHLFKGIGNTYLKGRTGPTIDELDIFASRKIATENPIPWNKSVFYNHKSISPTFQSYMDSLKTTAFLVIQNDSIVFEQYWEDYNENTISHSFSMGKTFTSIALGTCIDNGEVDSIQQPIHTILEGYENGLNKELTLEHLIGMCSGMNFTEDYKNPFGFPAKAFYGEDLPGLIQNYEVVIPPGKVFDYKSGNTQLASFAVHKASGKFLSEIIEDRIWKNIHAENDAYWILDKEGGFEKAFSGVYATARDFSRIGKLYMNAGFWGSKQLIDPEFVFESIRPLPLVDENGDTVNDYGYAWWLTKHNGKKIFYMRGILGQYVICIPSENLIITRLGRIRDEIKIGNHNKDLYFYIELAKKLIPSEKRRSNSK